VITRPLDLLSKLRPPPRNFDMLFLVNCGLIVLFFGLFSSHFVLSPGLRVNNEDPTLPSSPAALANAAATPISVSVNASGQILGDDGFIPPQRLNEWLVAQAKRAPGSRLLVIADKRVAAEVLTNITEGANAAGFSSVQLAMQAAPGASP
jgi:biopolymer transport protein ExbD